MFGRGVRTHLQRFFYSRAGSVRTVHWKTGKYNATLQKCPMPRGECQFSSSYVQTRRASLTVEVLVVLCYSRFDAVVCGGCGLCNALVLSGMCRGYSIIFGGVVRDVSAVCCFAGCVACLDACGVSDVPSSVFW